MNVGRLAREDFVLKNVKHVERNLGLDHSAKKRQGFVLQNAGLNQKKARRL